MIAANRNNKPSRFDWRLIGLFCISILGAMEMDIFTPSIPLLRDKFSVDIPTIQLLVVLNLVAYGFATIVIGPLAERYNDRKIMLFSLLIFIIGSMFCITTNNFESLLFGRVLQGFGMSAPNALSFVIVYKYYSHNKERYTGLLMGASGMATGLAPVIGSYLNLFINWQANFVFLAIFACFTIIVSYLTLEHEPHNLEKKISLATYFPLLTAKDFWKKSSPFLMIVTSFFTFITIAPVMLQEDMGVNLKFYGLYLGMLASCFGIMSLFTDKIFARFGKQKSYNTSLNLYFVFSIIVFAYLGLAPSHHPFLLILMLCLHSFSAVIPVSTSYPAALSAVKDSASRASSLLVSLRLGFCSIGAGLMSLFYQHQLWRVGLCVLLFGFFAWIFGRKINA